MHGSLPNDDQLKVFQRPPHGTRKVVVATNVAEASVTIPGIVYGNSNVVVIDCSFINCDLKKYIYIFQLSTVDLLKYDGIIRTRRRMLWSSYPHLSLRHNSEPEEQVG